MKMYCCIWRIDVLIMLFSILFIEWFLWTCIYFRSYTDEKYQDKIKMWSMWKTLYARSSVDKSPTFYQVKICFSTCLAWRLIKHRVDFTHFHVRVSWPFCWWYNWAPRHEGVLGSGSIAPWIFNFGTSWRWVISFTLRPLYVRDESPRYPLDRRLCGLQRRSGRGNEEKLPFPVPPGNRTLAVHPVA